MSQDPGLWIALGISAVDLLSIVVDWLVMHRVFVKILKQPPTGADKADPHECSLCWGPPLPATPPPPPPPPPSLAAAPPPPTS